MMQTTPKAKTNQQGFTLIELSIVLVIIGLIVGGVLVGQDLIKGAEIRATVSQIEKFDAAANTFRGKYNGLPGDLLNPQNFFSGVSGQSSTTRGLANGDGLVEGYDGTDQCNAANCVSGENAVFWYMLNQAGLINENIVTADLSDDDFAIDNTRLPASKIGGSIALNVSGSQHYWAMASVSGTTVNGIPPTIADSLEQLEAFQIDTKLDDGAPATGRVVSITNFVAATVSANTDCANGTASTSTYYTASTQAAQCQLSIRTSF